MTDNRIVFPLDFADPAKALEFAELLRDHVALFKVGLELFIQAGPQMVSQLLSKGGAGLFLDLKLHDIPTTVNRAMARIAAMGADFATVHACGSKDMLKAAVEGAGGRVTVLGVTVLTSEAGDKGALLDLVLDRAQKAFEAGCGGVICSPLEAGAVKEKFGKNFLAVTPGIRPDWGDGADDQKRKATPGMAVSSGADLLVIGRPIKNAADPKAAAEKINREIQVALAGE